jgi:NADP-dependent aldehyde dehydrogenase
MLTGQHIIGFQRSGKKEPTFQAVNPATSDLLPVEFCEATAAEIHRAAEMAAACFDTYRTMPLAERAGFLEAIAEEILALGDELIQRAMAETGLPEGRLVGERGRTVNQLKLFAQVVREGSWLGVRIDTAEPERQPLPKPDVRMMNHPLGPVAVFGASNFPLAFSVAGGDTASALAAGCPVIVKGHPAHPGTSEYVGIAVMRAAQRTGMPEGVFSLVQGSSIRVGQELVKHPYIKAVGFTGSFVGGKALFDLAAARPEPIPVFAEMGSTNPVFVLPGALKTNSKQIAEGLANSVTLGAGQFCTNPGLVLGIRSDLFETFAQQAATAFAAKPADTMLHKGIKNAYEAGINEITSIEDVHILAQGSGSTEDDNLGMPRLLIANGSTFIEHPRLEEEVFGPSSILIRCDSREEMMKIAENLRGHLTATIHATAEELAEWQDLVTVLERKVGRLVINGFPTGVEVCHAMVHGGPYPATTDSRSTSVGTAAIFRFLRPVCYQNYPQHLLPAALRNDNPLKIWRMVNGQWRNDAV